MDSGKLNLTRPNAQSKGQGKQNSSQVGRPQSQKGKPKRQGDRPKPDNRPKPVQPADVTQLTKDIESLRHTNQPNLHQIARKVLTNPSTFCMPYRAQLRQVLNDIPIVFVPDNLKMQYEPFAAYMQFLIDTKDFNAAFATVFMSKTEEKASELLKEFLGKAIKKPYFIRRVATTTPDSVVQLGELQEANQIEQEKDQKLANFIKRLDKSTTRKVIETFVELKSKPERDEDFASAAYEAIYNKLPEEMIPATRDAIMASINSGVKTADEISEIVDKAVSQLKERLIAAPAGATSASDSTKPTPSPGVGEKQQPIAATAKSKKAKDASNANLNTKTI